MKTIIWILVALFPLSCTQKRPEETTRGKQREEEASRIKVTQTQLDKKVWELLAEKLISRGDTTWIYNFTVHFFDEEGEKTSTLTADSGFIFQDTGDMIALGDVEVVTKDSSRLKTNSLKWKEKERKITSDDDVLIERKGKMIRGRGLITDPNLEHIVIEGKVIGYEGDK